jgi:hypothetical protein
MMFSRFNRRQFCRSTALLTLGLLTKDFLFSSPAIADETQQNNLIQEKYIIFVPFVKARQGGKMNVNLYSGESYLLDIPSHCRNGMTIQVRRIGSQGNDCFFELYTLYDSQVRLGDKVYEAIGQTRFLNNYSKNLCKSKYEQLEDGQAVSGVELELLDYVISTSNLDETIKNRYEIASQNSRLLKIAETINITLEESALNQEQKRLIRGTFEYIKSSLPIPNWQTLTQLDSIIYNSDLSDSLKQTYGLVCYGDLLEIFNNPTLWRSDLKKYQELSDKIITLSKFFSDEIDNKILIGFFG